MSVLKHHGMLAGAVAGGATDPYFSYVTLLVDASARANGTTPSDIDVIGKTPTYRGNAQCKTDQAKFGTSSLYFDGTNDRVSFADSVDFTFGTGDFTVEAFCRPSDTGARYVLGHADSFSGFYSVRLSRSGSAGAAQCYMTNGATSQSGNTAISMFPQDAWSHIAISRVGNNFYLCLNGAAATFYTSAFTLYDSSGAFAIGAPQDADSIYQWAGWIDQIRVTKGVGRYSGAYTVPTAAFPHA